jgi:ATP-dependent helicase/nuclease subunit B
LSSGVNVFTVPAGEPFLTALARAILSGNLPRAGGPAPAILDLPDITLMLPTRRATRALQEAFLAAAGGRALLLPQIRPINETDEELTLLEELAGVAAAGAAGDDIPPAVNKRERLLVLTQLVMHWSRAMRDTENSDPAVSFSDHALAAGSETPAEAAKLAAELASLMDMVENENASLADLKNLVPDNFSEHWRQTLDFLKIVTEFWPAHLREHGRISASEQRNRIMLAEARRIAASKPKHPLIVAGVTGSFPAAQELMRQVANLENGAIVLPGLDLTLDEESWQSIVPDHPEHPQYGLKKLLDTLGLTRADVALLPGCEISPRSAARTKLVSEAMRPAATTGRWHGYVTDASNQPAVAEALAGMHLIEAPGAQDEAEVVALILREAAEHPTRTAALVSPDRRLARRVVTRLESWGIRVDDSAGRPFGKTVPGAFLDLAINAIAKDFAPPELMALLKHPLTRLGLDAFKVRTAARALELGAFRAPYFGEGLAGVAAALRKAEDDTVAGNRRHAASRLWPDDWKAAHDLVARLREAYAPLTEAFARPDAQPLRELAAAHRTVAEALSRLPDGNAGTTAAPAESPLWQGEAGATAVMFFDSIIDETMSAPAIRAADYPDFYRSLLAGENVRPRVPVHPRLSIWGPFEARLQQPDIVILGSLNDGTWPESADPGPWLNRPMRASLNLPPPEEKIGHAAHDFTTLLGAETVYMTRALKVDGVPTVASRWLMRLRAVLAGMGLADRLVPETPWLGYARMRDVAPRRISIRAPEPRPPLDQRPRRMSVSSIESWIVNPYAIFARNILKLSPLPALGAEPDASLRGALIHEALSRFAQRYPNTLPADIAATLTGLILDVLTEYTGHPRVAAFWLPRFERFARWFAETEPERREGVVRVDTEITGATVLDGPAGPFTLTARADRIDSSASGLTITDYKTGVPPKDKSVLRGDAPQLPLEAAIALAEGFANIGKAPVAALRYIRASGGEPPGEEHTVKAGDIAQLAEDVLGGLRRLIARFDDETTPYRSIRRPRFSYDYDDYAHLARVAEWAADSEGSA